MQESSGNQIRLLSDRLDDIEQTRDQFFRQIANLDAEFTAKKREHDLLRNSTASISSVPYEILAEIFMIVRHSYSEGFEILVSHVNRHWREVALGTSALWTRIYRHEHQHALEPITAYLRQSRQSLIHLVISIGRDSWDRGDWGLKPYELRENISPFCRLIKPHFPRCCRIFIYSRNIREDSKMLDCLAFASAPMLWYLHLSLRRGYDREPQRILAGGAESLTHLHLQGVDIVECQPPLGMVTTLHLDTGHWSRDSTVYRQWSDVLSAIPCLTHLEFINSPRWPHIVPISLPTLRTISYNADDLQEASGLLLILKAPSLRNLTLYLSILRDECNDELALRGPSNFPSLQRLCLAMPDDGNLTISKDISSSNMRKLSNAFPFIVEIIFMDTISAVLYIRQLISLTKEDQSSHNGTEIWPQLHTISVCSVGEGKLQITEFREFLINRANSKYPIRTLLLPKALIADGTELSACTQPLVTIAECNDDGHWLSLFPHRV